VAKAVRVRVSPSAPRYKKPARAHELPLASTSWLFYEDLSEALKNRPLRRPFWPEKPGRTNVRRASKVGIGNAEQVIESLQSYDPGVGQQPGLRDAVLQPLQCFFNRSFN
jgi:hypothetical protein